MIDILMPKLSDSMEEGTILTWLKETGAQIDAGDELLEIETDKSTVTHTAEASGILEILAPEGTTIAVGQPIARIGERAPAAGGGPDTPASEAPDADHAGPTPAGTVGESESALGSSAVILAAAAAAPARSNGPPRSKATPLARRIAEELGIALSDVVGTGPLGRITRRDVLRAAGVEPEVPARSTSVRPAAPSASSTTPATTPAPSSPPAGKTRQEPTRLQTVIARRMAESKATIPHFQVETEVVMDGAVKLRVQLKALAGETDPVPSFNDFIIKASAVALRDHPLANGSYRDGAFELHDAINVGMAVAADGVLVVPTVFDAGSKSLGEIARETRALAGRVRDGSIGPPQLSGGTFTVSNLGMFGMTAITPVINPPQSAILGVGAMREHLVRRDGEIVERTLMTLTLSCDHRILYGADAARFLARIRELLESPLKMAL
jgi:pyruvate dehydrogenase E2 component (dihydrolipoamide acetyltransferase)